MKKILLLIFLTLCLSGCQKQEETPNPPATQPSVISPRPPTVVRQLFKNPVEAQRIELPGEAIPYWRDAAGDTKPPLLLFALHPFLQPLVDEQQEEVATLVSSGTPELFVEKGSFFRTDPVLVTPQAVSAALESELFSELIWVFPSTTPLEQMNLDTFREQMISAGLLTEAEAADLQLDNGTFYGPLRGVTFRAIHSEALTTLSKPVVLHLDLGYFKGLYKSEIKTPLYPLLLQTAKTLKPLNLQVRGVTLSYSTEEGDLSLETRFLINRFAKLLSKPEMLAQPVPEAWNLHSEALYTINFFMESKVTDLYEKAALLAPNDPGILYALALRQLKEKNLAEALRLLELASDQDPGYAIEFFKLAERAAEVGDFKNAVTLMQRGQTHLPRLPFADLQLANFYLQSRQYEEARTILNKLLGLPWSPTVHPDIPGTIESLLTETSAPHTSQKEHP